MANRGDVEFWNRLHGHPAQVLFRWVTPNATPISLLQANKKRPAPVEPAFVVFMVGQGGVEPPTLGFSVDNLKRAIPHHF
jgi:hypothetical protein